MPSLPTHENIWSTTLSADQSTISIPNISQSYTHLEIILSGQMSAATGIALQFNTDTSGTNYSTTYLHGQGSTSLASDRQSSLSYTRIAYGGTFRVGYQGLIRVWIPCYSKTTTPKTILSRDSIAQDGLGLNAGTWRGSNAAITTIAIIPTGAANFLAGLTVDVIGIKAA